MRHAPADIVTVAHFAEIGREQLAAYERTDTPATREYFERSVAESKSDAQAALRRLQEVANV
jgi:hypothetical protein